VSPPSAREVLDRRRTEQASLLASGQRFADGLDPTLDVRAAVVFGSVARGDFHDASDIDVLVVAGRLPERVLDRHAAIGVLPARVQLVIWTVAEWERERARGNPIAIEACEHGRVLRGDLAALS